MVEDMKSLPYSVWARAKKTVLGFDVSARANVNSKCLDSVDLDVQFNGPTTTLQFLGKGGESSRK